MVGSVDPTVSVTKAAMWAPQAEFWIGGPLTIVNFGDSGAIRGCADVSTILCPAFKFVNALMTSIRFRNHSVAKTHRSVKVATPRVGLD